MNSEDKKFRCGCKMCSDRREETRRRKEMGFENFPEAAKQLIYELDNAIMHLDEDNDYLNAVINGTYPNADDYIKWEREKIAEKIKNGPSKEDLEEEEKYPRWQIKAVKDGKEVWISAELGEDNKFIPKLKNGNLDGYILEDVYWRSSL